MASSWMKDIQDRVKRASNDVNVALQPRVAQAKRSLEQSIQQMGLKPGREIYEQDEALLSAVIDIENLRDLLTSIAASVDQHRTRLLDLARTQKTLAETLSTPSELVLPLLRKHLPSDQLDAQLALGPAQMIAANALSRFALDMATPMADLSRTFEQAYAAKVSPLKRRYITQKADYFRCLRQAAASEDPVRRDTLNAVAEGAIPGWRATSETLVAEIKSLLSYTISNLSEWSLNVTQAEAETYARSARAFELPARQAETIQNTPST